MKNKFIKYIQLVFVTLLITACYKEIPYNPEIFESKEKLYINSNEVFFDSINKIALCPIESFGMLKAYISYKEYNEFQINNQVIKRTDTFNFGIINNKRSFELKLIDNKNDTLNYNLKFTLLPIVRITHNEDKIPDEPKINAIISISDPTHNETINEFCAIERRGGSANSWPKHSYGIEIRKNTKNEDKKNIALFNMYFDDDWILDGLYSDISCVRNRASFDLWKSIQDDAHSQGLNTLPSAIKGKYVEVFINDNYNGLYSLSENISGEKLGLKGTTNDNGYLYKCENWNDVSRFLALSDTTGSLYVWEGWEQKSPKNNSGSTWKPLYNLVDFIVNSSSSEFIEQNKNFINTDQFIDFYIFINLITGVDNHGQNLILANRTVNAPFYFCPWDLDATWGRQWNSKERDEKGIISFKIIERYINNNPDFFAQKLSNRWFHLRDSIINHNNIYSLFNVHFETIEKSGAASREAEKWPASLPDISGEQQYLNTWIENRIAVLDEYYSSLLDQ